MAGACMVVGMHGEELICGEGHVWWGCAGACVAGGCMGGMSGWEPICR